MSFWIIPYLIACIFQVIVESIIGGSDAPPRTFTHQVSLQNKNGHFCGGSVISESWVLTAAHCNFKIDNIVVTGTLNRFGGIRHTAKSIIVHEDYNAITLANDIAVIELNKNIQFNSNNQAIQLAVSYPPSDIYSTATGWGYYKVKERSYPNYLKMLSAKTINYSKCLQYEPIDPNEPWVKLSRGDHFCLISPIGEGPCIGDSGGAIIWNHTQIGVVSFGADECAIGKPLVCTSISAFRNWIFTNTGI